ncbi:MAG TPA: hypothetical protein VF814_07265 [Casimicrobiaceae bacterium]
MRTFDLGKSLAWGLLALGIGAAGAQTAPPIPGPATDLYPGTREYRWTFYVPLMSVERREIVLQGPGLKVRSRRFEYEVPGLTYERRKLFPVAEFHCKYPDWQLPNDCGVEWHDLYADFPKLTMRREHIDADVGEWTSEERRIRVDIPRWTWTERTLTIVVPELTTEPPPPRKWSQASEVMVADASVGRARAALDARQAEAMRAVDAAVAALSSSIRSVEAQGADASKLAARDGASVDLYATRQTLLDDRARELARYTRIRGELDAAAGTEGRAAGAR